jgi:hypothetical protein
MAKPEAASSEAGGFSGSLSADELPTHGVHGDDRENGQDEHVDGDPQIREIRQPSPQSPAGSKEFWRMA